MNELVCRIVQFMDEVRSKYPDCSVDEQIVYDNRRNGTEFDWVENRHLCPFGYGLANADVWAFRCHIYKDGTAKCFCYPKGEALPVETVEAELFAPDEVKKLYRIMYVSTDSMGVYGPTLDNIEWNED